MENITNKLECVDSYIVKRDGLCLSVEYCGNREYSHPYYNDKTVWYCNLYEVEEIFGDDYPSDNQVLTMLESGGVLSDLGLTYNWSYIND